VGDTHIFKSHHDEETAQLRTRIAELEAALAQRDRMLRLAAIRKYRRKSHQDEWLADLRKRAEESQ
jgi:hypothetical protein